MKKFAIVLLVLILLPQVALANPCEKGTDANLGRCINQIYKWSLGLSALLAMLMMVLGGYKVMTAGGNAEQSTSGKSYIISAIVGMGLLFGAYLILNTINPDLVRFRDFSTNPFSQPAPLQGPPPPGGPRTP